MKSILLSLCLIVFYSTTGYSKGLTWNIHTFIYDQIFPSYSWAVSNLGNESENEVGNFFGDNAGQMGIVMSEVKKGQHIKVVIYENDIMEQSELEFSVLKDQNIYFYAYPQILYKWSILEKWKQPKPINVKIELIINGKSLGYQSKRIIARSINDCPFFVANENGVLCDLNYVYLSYVNENHPLIADKIIPEILKDGIINRVNGYQGINRETENYDEVYKQVYAVWDYFKKNDFFYSNLTSNYKFDEGFPMFTAQFVRTFSDIFNTKQANCVEGTVLMASILQKMGISTFLMTTPSHCFLGFSLDGTKDHMSFLETTILGTDISSISPDDRAYIESFQLTESDTYFRLKQSKQTYDMFIYALLVGNQNYQNDKDKFRNELDETIIVIPSVDELKAKFDLMNYHILDVNYYRGIGLLPLNL